jgi:5'-3' exonuclease
MNGILHASTKDVDMSNLDAYFNVLSGHLLAIVKQLNPRKNIILAIDGVAPLAKIDQQRMRRYKSSMNRIDGTWDSNAITPGTTFMFSIDEKIRAWLKNARIKGVLSKTKDGHPRNIVYSSHLVPGEGEHKLMQWVRDNPRPGETYVFYGLDADLIVLSLNLPVDHVYLVRERMDNWLNVNIVKKQLVKDMRLDNSKQVVQDADAEFDRE